MDHITEASSVIASLKNTDASFDRLMTLLKPPNTISAETDTMDSIGKITLLIKDAMAEQRDLRDSGDDAAIEDNKALLTSPCGKRSKLTEKLVV